MVVMPGLPGANMPVSQIRAMSLDSSCAFSLRNGTREGEPDSSSPSNRIETFAGSLP